MMLLKRAFIVRNMFIIAITIMICSLAYAQPPGGREGFRGPRGKERLDQFRKMRLVEVLKLNEEESVRFFARQSAHEDKMHDMMKSRNDVIDQLQAAVKEKGEDKALTQLADQAVDLDQQIIRERQRYIDEQRKSLTAQQFAKFLVFERNFDRQVRDAMGEMFRDRRGRHQENTDE